MPATVLPPDLAHQLEQARARIARQRVEAFVDYTSRVCGFDLQPLTLRSYNYLVAFDSPFVCGGRPTAEDVGVFVWVHHPDFGQHRARERRRVLARVGCALFPRFPGLNALLGFAGQLPRFRWLCRFVGPSADDRVAAACSEIRRLIDEALCDLPRAGDPGEDDEGNRKVESEGGKTAMAADILNLFARSLRIPHSTTEQLPLRRVVQLLRECLVADGGGKSLGMMHPEEAKVWREYLEEPSTS